ncbi:MAG: sigma 54-interacting transcriptional regulator [Syntrophales bacterium]|nr:sigma 54-interacting transcriptional regulator [Syntrophales bacterium]
MDDEERIRNSVKMLLGKPLDSSEAEKHLKVLQEKYQQILDGIEEGYVEVDLKGTIVLCNKSFSTITGYSTKELLGMNYRKFVSADVAEKVFNTYNEVYNSELSNKGFCYEITGRDGTKRIIENSISLIKDSRDRRKGFRSITRDITGRKHTERELEMHRRHLQAIFESVKDAIITFDSDMRIIESNAAAERICGILANNAGKEFNECMTYCMKNCFTAVKRILENGSVKEEYQIKCEHQHKPRQQVVITGSKLINSNGERIGTVIVIKDVTVLHYLENELRERHQFQNLIGKSVKMRDIFEILSSLTNLETTVLITGASGTGKSLVAKALHYSGIRAAKPIVTVNCSSLPESLLESELFGHTKGAFTGAIKDTMGRFETASDGTILLDEIGDISPRIQLKLLRVLEEKEYERVGESFTRKTNARVIACTNRNLKEKVRLGEFREDLFYRLKVVELKMPSLCERVEDIPLLIEYFLNTFRKKFSKNIYKVSNQVLENFMNYSWPGNIRELEHAMEHAFVFCNGPTVFPDHLPIELQAFESRTERIHESTERERDAILIALEKTGWNKAKAARFLRTSRTTLYRKIDKYRLFQCSDVTRM